MLVLSRKQDQAIVIAGDIKVVVLKVCGSSVKLGFIAPPETVIRRREVVDATHSHEAITSTAHGQ